MAGQAYNFKDIIAPDVMKGLQEIAALSKDINKSLTTIKVAPKSGKGLETINAQLKVSNEYTKSLTSLNKQRIATEKKAETLRKKEISEQNKLNLEYQKKLALKRQLETEIKKEAREYAKLKKAEADILRLQKKEILSLKELMQLTNALTQKRSKLTLNTKKEREEYDKLTVAIAKNNRELLKQDKSIGRSQRNVGNYKSAIKGLAGSLGLAGGLAGAFMLMKRLFTESIDLYEQQTIAVAKLTTILKQRTNATDKEIQSVLELTQAQQKSGVIGDEIQIAGAQQLATFVTQTDSVNELIPAMNNLIAQQKGLNATQGDATNIANLMGRAFQGQLGSLTRVGISFSEAEGKILKYGDEQERAAILAEIITNNVGNMNEELAKTDLGKIQNVKNNLGDLKEEIGKGLIPVVSKFYELVIGSINILSPEFEKMRNDFSEIGTDINTIISAFESLGISVDGLNEEFKDEAVSLFKDKLWELLNPLGGILKSIKNVIKGFKDMLVWAGLAESDSEQRTKKIAQLLKDKNKILKTLSKEERNIYIQSAKELKEQFDSDVISLEQYQIKMIELINSIEHKKKQVAPIGGSGGGGKSDGLTMGSAPKQFDTIYDGGRGASLKFVSGAKEGLHGLDQESGYVENMILNWYQRLIKRVTDKTDKRSLIGRIFNVSDEDAELIVRQSQEIYNKITGLIQDSINKERALIDEKLSLIDDQIEKTQELLKSEEEKNARLIEQGASYDATKTRMLNARLNEEKKLKQKALIEEKKIKEKQRKMDIVNANIAIATSVLNALKVEPPWLGIAMSVVMGALGAVQLNQIRTAKYAEGTNYAQLNGNKKGIDTIPAMINEGERIIPTKENSKIPLNFPNSQLPIAVDYYLNRKGETINKNGDVVMLNNNNELYLSEIAENTRNNKVYSHGKLIEERKNGYIIRYN